MCAPYVPNLLRIEKDKTTGKVVVTYTDGKVYEFVPKMGAEIIDIKPTTDYDVTIAAPIPDHLFKRGAKINFVTDLYKQRHHHRVKLDSASMYSIQSYWNNADGHFKVGQEVIVEIAPGDVDRLGIGCTRIICYRATPSRVDNFIEFFFYSTPDKIWDGLYKGKISLMSFVDKKDFDLSRCYVKAMIRDLEKYDIIEEGVPIPKDENNSIDPDMLGVAIDSLPANEEMM
jgi:hypothetical protein